MLVTVDRALGWLETRLNLAAASDLLIDVFGEKGRHPRAVIGVLALGQQAVGHAQRTLLPVRFCGHGGGRVPAASANVARRTPRGRPPAR